MKIILASNSPRRKELLKKVNLNFDVVVSNIEEDENYNLTPQEYAKHLSFLKANSVYKKTKGLVIGADTIVCIDNEILGKPKNLEDAKKTLKKLSNKTHSVITGFTIICEDKIICDYEETKVVFNNLSDILIDDYVKTGLPLDKAGSYGIQDGYNLVKEIVGDYDNVVGLPTNKILKYISELIWNLK